MFDNVYSKAEECDFLSDVQYLGKVNPGPSQYSPNKSYTLPRSSSWALIKPKKEKPHWKPQKTHEPDVGTYEPLKAEPLVRNKAPKYGMP